MDDREKLLELGKLMIERYADGIQIPFVDVKKTATEGLQKKIGRMTDQEAEGVVDEIRGIIDR